MLLCSTPASLARGAQLLAAQLAALRDNHASNVTLKGVQARSSLDSVVIDGDGAPGRSEELAWCARRRWLRSFWGRRSYCGRSSYWGRRNYLSRCLDTAGTDPTR